MRLRNLIDFLRLNKKAIKGKDIICTGSCPSFYMGEEVIYGIRNEEALDKEN